PYFHAGRLTLKVATKTGALALRVVDRALGLRFLADLSEFFLAFDGMYDGFKERAERVFALLRAPTSGFVLVAGPASQALDEAVYFRARLGEKRMPLFGIVVNRLHPDPAAPTSAARRAGREPEIDADLEARLLEIYRDEQTVARADRKRVGRLEVDTG